MFTLISCLTALIIPYHLKAQTLQWDDAQHSSFALTIEHNLSQTIVLNQVTYDSDTYELVDPIMMNATNSLLTTIQAYMTFEIPIDDIKESDDNSTNFRVKKYDFQSVSRARAATLLEDVHNGDLQYNRDVSYKNVLIDGTYESTVYFKNYPITTSCPTDCENPDNNAFSPTYGGGASCEETCILYLCEYNNEHWGAGSCDPLAQDDNITAIESQHEAWWAVIEGSGISYRIRLAWGFGEPTSSDANDVFPNKWSLKYLDNSGNDLDKTCDSASVYWDNGHLNGELYKPITWFGNQYRLVSYSLNDTSVLSQPSVPITIGSYSSTRSTTFGTAVEQAITDKFSHQNVIMDDIGYYSANTSSLSNSSEWLFINKSYFGYECDQIMVDQLVWEAASCGTCMDHVLSTWDTAQHGITTVPYYDDLDLSNEIQGAVTVITNLTKCSENNITIDFNYIFQTTNITISSTNFAFKQPSVCNGVSQVSTLSSTKSTNVSFTNCGAISADFTYTTNCANGYSTTTVSSVSIAVNEVKSSWTSAVTNANCDTVSSITISTSSCPEFWNITCSWSTTLTLLTPEPTSHPTQFPTVPPTVPPTALPSVSPTPQPTVNPTLSPTPQPTVNPTLSPTAAPVSFFASCTSYQVVPVRGAVGNAIVHQELCVASKEGHYIVDINAQKPYYIVIDSGSVSNTTINKINTEDYNTGIDSTEVATGSALIGHSIIYIETWFDVLAYLGLDVSSYSSQPISTSIKIDILDMTDISTLFAQSIFKTNLAEQIVSELSINSDQITVNGLRSGSIIADIEISSTSSSTKSALEISVDLQNYIASHVASTASVSSPLNSVNNYFYANQTHHIVFTNCPYRITATALEGETVMVSWDTPSINARVNDNNIVVYQAIGESSGESFSAGSYFIRYVALSTSNTSITPKYCSFAIVVDEEEWVLEFMGIEFNMTTLIIIGTVLFAVCTGSIIYSCIMRRRRRSCCQKKAKQDLKRVQSDAPTESANDSNFKAVIVSSHDTNKSNRSDPPKLTIKRASAPGLS